MPRCPFLAHTARILALSAVLVANAFASEAPSNASTPAPRERTSFNADWRFTKDDPTWLAAQIDYHAIRSWLLPTANSFRGADAPRYARPDGNLGSDITYAQPSFDDTTWRTLNLPHDWAIEGPFRQEHPGDTGKLPYWGIAWYRKHFQVPASDAGRRLTLEIDGAMSYSTVWINGHFVGGWPYGYASYALDLTPYIKYGTDNVIAIRLDNPPESSRWYPGAGIYRNVWLTKTAPVHTAHWGVTITTPHVTTDEAIIAINTLVRNDTDTAANITLSTQLYALDTTGKRTPVATTSAAPAPLTARIPAQRDASSTQNLHLANPKLWSIETPALYVAITRIQQDGRNIDTTETTFGIRTLAFDATRGFLLNGKLVRIQGVCNHHDLGALGGAINTHALERQLRILRDMGCNAIRTSHNPPAPELLDLCDRMGFLVMDEAFDAWAKGKSRNDYHVLFPDWHEPDLRALVRRDRNHPSVVMWSIGNEVIEQWGDDGQQGWKLAARLAAIVREEDRTRPVTAAFNGEQCGYNGFQNVLDAVGYNYRVATYAAFRRDNPATPLIGAETASALSSRGVYVFPVNDNKVEGRADFQISSYDYYATEWGTTPDTEWRAADSAPGYAGEFVWTGFDYLGEPTPYNGDSTVLLNYSDPAQRAKAAEQLAALGKIPVPSRSSYFGIIDLAGFPKDRYYLYQSRWRPDHPMAHILPHWTWPERAGQITPVHVYTSGDEVELFLNGRSLGRKKKPANEYRVRWDDVAYEPGELHAIAYKNGQRWAEDTQRTAGPAAKMTLTPERTTLAADGTDLAFVSGAITDKDGVLASRASNTVHFTLTGPGEIIATDNGDATSFESFQSPQRRAFNGRCLVIIRTKADAPGQIVLRAESDGLETAETKIQSSR